MRGGISKNRQIGVKQKSSEEIEIRIDELAKSMPTEEFKPVILSLEKPKKVWGAIFRGSISRIKEERTFEARYEC